MYGIDTSDTLIYDFIVDSPSLLTMLSHYPVIIPGYNGASNGWPFWSHGEITKALLFSNVGYGLREFWLDLGNTWSPISWHHDTFIFVGEFELLTILKYSLLCLFKDTQGDFLV